MKDLQAAAVTKEQSAIIASQLTSNEVENQQPREGDILETRFGKVTLRKDNPITFPKGLLGIPDKNSYCLLDFPIQKFSEFKLLQSLEDHALSFITLPVANENTIIDKADITAGCKELGYAMENTALLLIVSVHRELKKVRLSCNARAPLFINIKERTAQQYVLHNNKYLVRHMLTA